jgi:hypothetical protein|mmetsp:Transcript_45101/g.73589  ORF Transcript_45101/g.73589 Transcript_45101/m.73589 type:complete len:146 (+) Transcript_45101:145-582(+)
MEAHHDEWDADSITKMPKHPALAFGVAAQFFFLNIVSRKSPLIAKTRLWVMDHGLLAACKTFRHASLWMMYLICFAPPPSSICELRDRCPTLTNQKCFFHWLATHKVDNFLQKLEAVGMPGSSGKFTQPACKPPKPCAACMCAAT